MRLLRTLSGLTAVTAFLAGCGGNAGAPTTAVTPRFVASAGSGAAPSPWPASDPPNGTAPSGPGSAPPPASATTTAAKEVRYVFPVKASNAAYHPTHAKYPATDIFAGCGEPVVATTSGVVLEISLTDAYVKGLPDGPDNGGLFVSILGDDGVRYYGSHLSKVTTGIRAGVRVAAGQSLGEVGRSGNANNVCHLHYGISPPCAGTGDWKVRRGVVWPAGFLDSWREKGQKSPVATVAAWKRSHNCRP